MVSPMGSASRIFQEFEKISIDTTLFPSQKWNNLKIETPKWKDPKSMH
jgi:hypothetical protein